MRVYKIGNQICVHDGKLCGRPDEPFTLKIVIDDADKLDWKIYSVNCVDLLIDWGDGTSDVWNGSGLDSHTYAGLGTYIVKFVSGTVDNLQFGTGDSPSTYNNLAIREVMTPVPASLGLTSAYKMFPGCWNLATWAPGWLDVASQNITDMFLILDGVGATSTRYNENVGGWKTGNVTDLSYAFGYAYPFAGTGLQYWDVSKVTNFRWCFYFCYLAFTGAEVVNWNTAAATDFSYMFNACNQFSADISGWNWENIIDATAMINNAGGLWSTANYDKLLISIASQSVKDTVPFGVGGTKYSSAAASAHDHLVNDHGWNISDGGMV